MFVFVDAKDSKIELHVEQQRIGAASTPAELALMFAANNITFGQSIHCSSSIAVSYTHLTLPTKA